jgi:hypothetical protein
VQAAVYVATMYCCNCIVNKLPNATSQKSKEAYRREYERSIPEGFTFRPVQEAIDWLAAVVPMKKEEPANAPPAKRARVNQKEKKAAAASAEAKK